MRSKQKEGRPLNIVIFQWTKDTAGICFYPSPLMANSSLLLLAKFYTKKWSPDLHTTAHISQRRLAAQELNHILHMNSPHSQFTHLTPLLQRARAQLEARLAAQGLYAQNPQFQQPPPQQVSLQQVEQPLLQQAQHHHHQQQQQQQQFELGSADWGAPMGVPNAPPQPAAAAAPAPSPPSGGLAGTDSSLGVPVPLPYFGAEPLPYSWQQAWDSPIKEPGCAAPSQQGQVSANWGGQGPDGGAGHADEDDLLALLMG